MNKALFIIFFVLIACSIEAQDKNIPAPIAPYSPGVLVNETLYISGQIPINPSTDEMITGDIKVQTRASDGKCRISSEIVWL